MLKGLTLLSLCGIKLCVSDELTDKLICTRGLTDRAIGYGPIGWGFESLRVYHKRVELSSALFFCCAVSRHCVDSARQLLFVKKIKISDKPLTHHSQYGIKIPLS